MPVRRLLLASTLLFLSGCDSTSPTTITAFGGALMFTYSGGVAGSYAANGERPSTQAARESQQWSHAVNTANNDVFISSASPRSGTTHDYAEVIISRNTTGTETINPSCSFNCTGVYLEFAVTNGSVPVGTHSCYLTSGSVTITSITTARVIGTFSGTGTCATPSGSSSWTVTNGTFDIAVQNTQSS